MSKTYQLELPHDPSYQIALIDLQNKFKVTSGRSMHLSTIFRMCLLALQDITPTLIDKHLASFDLTHTKLQVNDILLQSTTNLSPESYKLLTKIKKHLIVNKNRLYSRRRIALAIFILANDLDTDHIQYILSEYRQYNKQ